MVLFTCVQNQAELTQRAGREANWYPWEGIGLLGAGVGSVMFLFSLLNGQIAVSKFIKSRNS